MYLMPLFGSEVKLMEKKKNILICYLILMNRYIDFIYVHRLIESFI